MALNPQLSDLAANAEINALTLLLDGGYLDLYDGEQPENGNLPVTTQVRLASTGFGVPAFGPGVAGVATANEILSDVNAAGVGDATWYRCYHADHVTPICDGSVGTSNCNINMNSTYIAAHARVDVPAFTLTANKQALC